MALSFAYNIIFIKLMVVTVVEAGLKHAPADIITRPGEDVRFNCSTDSRESVDWTYRKEAAKSHRNIFIGRTGGGGDKSKDYMISNSIYVDVDIQNGQYDLIIRNVKQTDEGEYTCCDINDPDSPASAKLQLLVTGEPKMEVCSYDVVAVVGSELQLNFTTTQSDSIHLEHRSVHRSYLLHVFRDGRIVNDYYVLSGRFSVKVSAGIWTLVIKDVQMADAGTYICSEDNGLGKQEVRELIVIESKNASSGAMCSAKNCTVEFAGNCPPRLEWRQLAGGENGQMKRLRSITTRADAIITTTRTEDGDQEDGVVSSCVVLTKSSEQQVNQHSCLIIQDLGSCTEDAAVHRQSIVPVVTATVLVFAVLTSLLASVYIIRRSFRCQLPLKPDDVITPAREPMRGTAMPVATLASRETPAARLLAKIGTPVASSANGGAAQESSTRRRPQNSANKENMHADSVNNPDKISSKNTKAKRKLDLISSKNNADD